MPKKTSILAPDGRSVMVADSPCAHCLLGPSPIVSTARVREILAECSADGPAFVCHEFTLKDRSVVCASFFKSTPNRLCQVAGVLNLVTRVPLP